MPLIFEKWWSSNCQVHGYHWPPLHSTVFHHIHPLGMGGPDSKENLVEVCPNGHVHIHMLLDLMMDRDGVYTTEHTKGFTREEIRLARLGYDRWVAAQTGEERA